MLTFGSLFSGIGGIDLGLERAGMVCRWQVEIDDYASRVLAKHWPNVARYRDVRECGAHNLQAVDLICGGFPCQDISYAGKGAGLDGERSGLWREYARIVCELRPRFVIVENVSALLDRGMGRVLGNLAAIGYDAEWSCISASEIGAPHRNRDRIFLVAYTAGVQRDGGDDNRVGCTAMLGVFSKPGNSRHEDLRMRGYWKGDQPGVLRVANGVPNRVDRLKCLGNAVVPQVAEFIGRRIMEAAGY